MRGILLDVNILGHGPYLLRLMRASGMMDFWEAERVNLLELADLGLADDTPDRDIWRRCQAEQIVLLTDNRNTDGPHSLGRTLADSLTPTSLPVLTIGSKERFERDRAYAVAVAVSLVETVQDISAGRLLGTDRIYLPRASAS